MAYISVKDAAGRLGVDHTTVLRHIKKGKIRGSQVLGTWRVDEEQVNHMAEIGVTRWERS